MTKRSRLGLLVLVMLAALAFAYFRVTPFTQQADAPDGKPAPVTSSATATAPDASKSQTAPQPGDAQERHLVGVVLREDASQSQAHIMRRGVTGVFKLQDPVPPDQAVLTSIQMTLVTLQPAGGEAITLPLENLTDEERFLFSEGFTVDDIEDPVGDLQPEDPAARRALAELRNPYEACDAFSDKEEHAACLEKTDEEIDRRSEQCEDIEDQTRMETCFRQAFMLSEPEQSSIKPQ